MIRFKFLILALFPIMLLGQANLTYVRSYDSSFAIVNQAFPDDTLWKFTKSGYLIKYESNVPTDTLGVGGAGGADSLFHSDTQEWLVNSDTIPKADSSRQTSTADTFNITKNGVVVGKIYQEQDGDLQFITTDPSIGINISSQDLISLTSNEDMAIEVTEAAGDLALTVDNGKIEFITSTSNAYMQLDTLHMEEEHLKALTITADTGYISTTLIAPEFKANVDSFNFKDLGVRFNYQITNLNYLNGNAQSYISLSDVSSSIYHGTSSSASNIDIDSSYIEIEPGAIGSFSTKLKHTYTNDFYSITESADTLIKITEDSLSAETMSAKFQTIITDTGKFTVIDLNETTIDTIIELSDAIEQETAIDSIKIGGYTISFNASEGVHQLVTAKDGVVWQGALEDLAQVYNNSGVTISNGVPTYYSGFVGDTIATVGIASSLVETSANRYAGIATCEILNNEWGFIAIRGNVHGLNTTSLNHGANIVYLGDSILIDTVQPFPHDIVVVGVIIGNSVSDGIVYAHSSQAFDRQLITRSNNFTTQGIGTGVFYKFGSYNFPAADANLTQASTTQAYGTANVGYGAHAVIVAGAAGSTDAGVVGLRVTGTSIDDEGNRVDGDADTLLYDITATLVDSMYEGKKFNGTITFELITISGSPTTYSFDFNYGYAQYEDGGNRDWYLTGLDVGGEGGAADANFDIELLHHCRTGWTYSAAAFVPGGMIIAQRSTDMAPEDDVASGLPIKWKRTDLNQFIEGTANEGILYRITTSTNNAVQTMDIHINAAVND